MSNGALLFITIAASFLGVIFFFRCWGKQGLFCWIAFASVLANIEVIKCVDIFGMSVTLGNVIYGSNFLATDIISGRWGGRESRRAVRIGFAVLVAVTGLSQLSLLFIPNSEDFASPALHTIFSLTPQICGASMLSYLVSNTLDTYLFDYFGRHTQKLWLKNNAATIISQAVDSCLFTCLAFAGVFPFETILELILTTLAIKAIIAALDTPFAYWGRSIGDRYYNPVKTAKNGQTTKR